MTNLHEFYDQLTDRERMFVDQRFRNIFANAKALGIPLTGNDDAEIAVDALSRLIVLSRTKEPTK